MNYNQEKAKKDLMEVIEGFLGMPEVHERGLEITKSLKNDINVGVLADVINGEPYINAYSIRDLYFIISKLEKFHQKHSYAIRFDSRLLSPSKYFTENEIKGFENKLGSDFSNKISTDYYVFEDVVQVTEDMYTIARITAEQLRDLGYNRFFRYDKEMQRETEKRTSKITGREREKIKIYSKSLKSIKEEMKAGTYTPTTLSINILQTGEELFTFKDGKMTIYKEDWNSLIDGMHRYQSIIECLEESKLEGKEFNQVMQLNIFNFNKEKARHFIWQQAQQNPISKDTLQAFNGNNVYSILANEINTYGMPRTNLLFGRLGKDLSDVKKLGSLYTLALFADAIEKQFPKSEIEKMKQRKALKVYLVEFFNEILSTHEEELKNISNCRKEVFELNHNMAYVYLFFAKKLYQVTGWEDIIVSTLQKLDHTKLLEFSIEKDYMNNNNIKKLNEYLDSIELQQ